MVDWSRAWDRIIEQGEIALVSGHLILLCRGF
jgi:hypothetical protein